MIQCIPMFFQHANNIVISRSNKVMHFLVNQLCNAFTIVTFMPEAFTEEYLVLLFTEYHGAELGTHAETSNHLTNNMRYIL